MSVKRRLSLVDSDRDKPEKKLSRESILNVAFASADMEMVDQHFGSASCFLIYRIDKDKASLFEIIQFGDQEQDGNEDKLMAKLDALEKCIAVYSLAVGASAIAQLNARNIRAVRVMSGTSISDLVSELQHELCTAPGVWLTRAIQKQNVSGLQRFDNMEAEGWEE